MTTIEQCPFCGWDKLTAKKESSEVTVPYGPPVSYESAFYVCGRCKQEAAADDEEREAARQESIVKSVRLMLDHLKNEGISTAHFERALRLPQRTAARWKIGNVSAPSIALLRCVRTFPWLLDYADDDFRFPPASKAYGSPAAFFFDDSGSAQATNRVTLKSVPGAP